MTTNTINCQDAIQAFLSGSLEGTRYTQYYDVPGAKEGCCEVLYLLQEDVIFIFCAQSSSNAGMSITNAAPVPWTAAEEEIAEPWSRSVWLEVGNDSRGELTFDRVELRNNRPRWARLPSPSRAAA